jgi:D-alanyl-lipoteichoic acid acyltransferase DltB (MBOAT superfamily)
MLFNSFSFLFAFLPLTLAGYAVAARYGASACAAWLAAASLVFYGCWDWRYLPLLLASIVVNYTAAGWIAGATAPVARHRRLVLAVLANLLLLAYYKYAFFLAAGADAVVDAVPTTAPWWGGRLSAHFSTQFAHIVLPIGISFFTFTQIAFLVDTARGKVRERRLLHYVLFVTYFPHLIAGPVLHHAEMMPQFAVRRGLRITDLSLGFSLLILGLAKKVLLADSLAPQASAVFDAGVAPSLLQAWGGVLAYAFQLYFDFSGYSDMAVGLSRMFGIRLPFNFDSPYQAADIAAFWRRWHMTLSRFLRDYLYIPLGGNRRGPLRQRGNLMLTMLLGGLWHGAGWNFVIWGGLHGVFLVIHQGWRGVVTRRGWQGAPGGRLRQVAGIALTFAAVCSAWVFFRAPDMRAALHILRGMAGGYGVALPEMVGARLGPLRPLLEGAGVAFYLGGGARFSATWGWIAVAALIVFGLPNSQRIMGLAAPRVAGDDTQAAPARAPSGQGVARWQHWPRWSPSRNWAWSLGALALAALLSLSHPSEFLYFQF